MNKRLCIECGKQHNTVVQDSKTEKIQCYLDHCTDCLMSKTKINILKDQVVIEKEERL